MNVNIKTHKYDIKFIRLLLLLAVGMVKLAQGDIHPAVKKFIKDIYNVRVGDNLIRLLQVDKIVEEYVEEIKVKATNKNSS